MKQATVTKSIVEEQPFYPQCYLSTAKEVEIERNLIKLEMAFFCAGVSHEAAHQASLVISNIKGGYIISRSEYQVIHRALGEMK